jgi:multiple sugar transport system permease protein
MNTTGAAYRRREWLTERAIDAALMAFSLAMILPLVFLIGNAFKTPADIIAWPPTVLPREPTLENLRSVIAETPLPLWLLNSLIFALLSTASILVTSAMAGYVFAKFHFRSIQAVFAIILATAIVPFEVYMIPLFFKVQALGLLNTIPGLLVGYLVMSFGIFLIRQNVIAQIPDELIEAARVDGASEIWIFVRVVVPLLLAPLGALAVLAFFQAWTAFTWPLVVATTADSYTVEVGLALFQTGFTVDLGKLSAASTLVLIPSLTVFVFLRRSFVQGTAATGMKE